LKVLHLSDIHINRLKVSANKVLRTIKHEDPDFIIMTGDYIEKPKHIPQFLEFLAYIKGESQVFVCLGNHDYKAFSKNKRGIEDFKRLIENTGAVVLENSSACHEKNSKKYNIIGFEDIRHGVPDLEKAFGRCCRDTFMNIALSHNPDIALLFPRGSVDYLFCGHFHGGQIWMPFNLEFKLLRKDRLCKADIRWGLHRINSVNVYINRGLGNVLFPLRFLSRPEISVYYLP